MKKWFVILFLICDLTTQSLAQSQQPQAVSSEQSMSSGPKRQLATIVYAGLGGAVLGLSTLSFYGRPQDHLSNIAFGFGIGIIVGAMYTTYNAATNPKEFYSTEEIHGINDLYAQSRLNYFIPPQILSRWDVTLLKYTF